jgi:23S rRNA pseudouridine2604 synthase
MALKRLNKAMAETGFCSRRAADKLIADGKVTVNNTPTELGMRVGPFDVICVDGEQITKTGPPVYLAYHKPVGITCTTDTEIEGNIITAINFPERIFHIGRLDKPSEGLIFMTNDGDIVNQILRSENNHEKEYVVRVDKKITPAFLKDMAQGVPILDTVTKPCKVTPINDYSFTIVLTQGLNRQIRRMCKHFDYDVYKLKRVRIMNISLGDLLLGEFRHFTPDELNGLKELIGEKK